MSGRANCIGRIAPSSGVNHAATFRQADSSGVDEGNPSQMIASMIVETRAVSLAVVGFTPNAHGEFLGCAGFIQPQAEQGYRGDLWVHGVNLNHRADLVDTQFRGPGEKLHAVMHLPSPLPRLFGGTRTSKTDAQRDELRREGRASDTVGSNTSISRFFKIENPHQSLDGHGNRSREAICESISHRLAQLVLMAPIFHIEANDVQQGPTRIAFDKSRSGACAQRTFPDPNLSHPKEPLRHRQICEGAFASHPVDNDTMQNS
nr:MULTISPECIES: hypothetical protein [unclassified Rhizobium]